MVGDTGFEPVSYAISNLRCLLGNSALARINTALRARLPLSQSTLGNNKQQDNWARIGHEISSEWVKWLVMGVSENYLAVSGKFAIQTQTALDAHLGHT